MREANDLSELRNLLFPSTAHLSAVATVGLTESMLSLVFAVAMGLSLSTTAMVARRTGEKDPEGAAVAGVQAIALGLMVSLVIGIPCFIFAPRLLQLMGATPATLIGRSIGVLYQFYRLMHGTERIHILTRQLRLRFDVLFRLLRVSLTGILQFAIAHTSWIGWCESSACSAQQRLPDTRLE